VIALSLAELLKRALMVGAIEVRLIPGRRTVVVTVDGENEVRGEPQTPERISALIDPVMTREARRALGSGWAEWEFQLPGRGTIRTTAQVKVGLVHVAFFLDRLQEGGVEMKTAPEPAAGAPAGREVIVPDLGDPGDSIEIDDDSLKGHPVHPPNPVRHVTQPSAAQPAALRTEKSPLPTTPSLPPARQAYDSGLGGGSTAEIDRLLAKMLEVKASDLHISTGSPPILRRDGEMEPIAGEKPLSPEQVQRILWPIVPPRNREEFHNTHDSDFAYELPGKARFRVNIFVDLRGMGAVLRVIPSKILTVDDLGLPKELMQLCHLPKGLVLVTGPTGSGKSTTLAALIDYVNTHRAAHIITIEDPVEFVHPNKKCLVNQRQVSEHTTSFKAALRAALREDPDIVLLGEMRDLETVSIALETAETGHLVFGTLHTSSAPSTVDRIIDQYPSSEQAQIRVMLSNSLKGVICQMLCRKVSGGRVAALEVMFGVPAIANLIREQKIFQIPSIMQTARNSGMRLMNDSLLELVKNGVVAPDEALSKSNDKATLVTLLKQANLKI
jgi:twitching motility protein PilT